MQQQNSPRRNYPQESQYYIPPQRKHTMLTLGLILIVIVGAIGLYFAIKPKLQSSLKEANLEQTTNVYNTKSTPTLEISTLRLCNSIDENSRCNENTDRIFKRGKTFYLYSKVTIITPKTNEENTLTMTKSIRIEDDKGITLSTYNEVIYLENPLEAGKTKTIPITTTLESSTTDAARKETLHLTVTDKASGQKTTKDIEYEMI